MWQVHIRHDEHGLQVTHDSHQWISNYKVRGWAPLPTWRFGFGARAASSAREGERWDGGIEGTGRQNDPRAAADYPVYPERHWLEELTISSGLLIAGSTAPVTLSFNGQQYAPEPLPFDYYAMPSVSSVTPTTGPLAGGTLVTVSGSKLDDGTDRTDSHSLGYRCRFNRAPYYDVRVINPALVETIEPPRNACAPFVPEFAYADSDCLYGSQVVNATYGDQFGWRTYGAPTEAGSMMCVTPPRHNARDVELELSLNAQQYTKDKLPFTFYREVVLHSLWPLAGPQHGGTSMLINATHLGNGTDFRCRFFGLEYARSCCAIGETRATFDVDAPYDVDHGLVRCVTPPAPAVGLVDGVSSTFHGDYPTYPLAFNTSLHVTKNGQNYDIDGLPFAFYREPVPILHDPPGGPRKGNTTVTLYGAYSGGFTKYCRFGEVGQVPATLRYEPERLICSSPDSRNTTLQHNNVTHRRPVDLHVSLNGQQYHLVGVYYYYDDPIFTLITPPSGPTRGGTQCTILGIGLAANIQPGLNGAHQYFCMYGRHGRVTASYVADETLRCDSPSADEVDEPGFNNTIPPGPRTVSVTITINDQDYHDAAEFQYYVEPMISEVLPNTGPIYGGAHIVVRGSSTFAMIDREEHFATFVCQFSLVTTEFSHNGTHTNFADLRVPAVRSVEDSRVLDCVSPPLTMGTTIMLGFVGDEGRYEMPFTVSLNGQQFTPRSPIVTGMSLPPVDSNVTDPIDANVTQRAVNFTYFGIYDRGWSAGPSQGRPYNLPTSGPASGNTSVVVYGNPLDLTGGNHYQCRIGPLLVNATYIPPDRQVQFGAAGILCMTDDSLPPGDHPVEVTLNAQQFTQASVNGTERAFRHFVVYDPPEVDDTFPRSGPQLQSFALRLHGRHLINGTDYVCRFGHVEGLLGANLSEEAASWGAPESIDDFPATPPPCCSQLANDGRGRCLGDMHACTAASIFGQDEVRCMTPRVATPRIMSVRVTLNGQQYAGGAPSVLIYPPPAVNNQVPTHSASLGGSSILVHGSGFMPVAASAGSATGLPTIRCVFGTSKVPASALSPSVVRCFTPPAARAAAFNEIVFDSGHNASSRMIDLYTRGPATGPLAISSDALWRASSDPTLGHGSTGELTVVGGLGVGYRGSPFVMYGDAHFDDGVLKLTRSLPQGGNGEELGFVLLRSESFFASPQRSFLFDFDLRMGGFTRIRGGDGFSISYGDLPQPPTGLGELGAGLGLRIIFRTYIHDRITIMWGGNVMHTIGVSTLRTPTAGEFAHVHIKLERRLLDLWYRGVRLLHGLRCPWFYPQPEWQWALEARAGQRADDHWIRNMTMRSTSSVDDLGAVELRLTLNDQDYTTGSTPFHNYYGHPALTPGIVPCRPPSVGECANAFSPSSGPTDGGTLITVYGSSLSGGDPYVCRFGNAPFAIDPYPSDSGGRYSGDSGHFARLAAMLAGCSEDPLNTLLPYPSIRGDAATCAAPPSIDLPYAHDPFTDRHQNYSLGDTKTIIDAVYLPTRFGMGGEVRCLAPASNVTGLAPDAITVVALEMSLNAQDYSTNAAGFTYYAPPHVIRLSPSSGPLHGGTRVLIIGSHLTGGSDYRCAFGASTLPVYAQPMNLSTSTLYCVAPVHHYSAVLVDVEVTLNGQQYTGDRAPFSVHAPVAVDALSPSSGPTEGETVVILTGGPFANGSDYRCRIAPSAPTSDGVPPEALTADYWREEAVHATVGAIPLNSSAMRCVTPRQPRVLRADVEVTLNGQQYTLSRRQFEYTAPQLIISWVSPSSGPHHGGTHLVVHAAGIRLGVHYCCRLSVQNTSVAANHDADAVVFRASFDPAGSFTRYPWAREPATLHQPTASAVDSIRCITPDVVDANMRNQTLTLTEATRRAVTLGLPLSVSVATNCQQYTAPDESVRFTYFGSPPKTTPEDPRWPEIYRTYTVTQPPVAAPLVLAFSPSSGPLRGDTNITVYGGPFLNGSDLRCRFAPLMVMVAATPATGGSTLRCQSPAISHASLANVTTVSATEPMTSSGLLEVTLNGQQYESGNMATYESYAHPRVSQLSPASGPIVGGTMLSVAGLGLWRGTHRLCRFIVPSRAYPGDDHVGATVDASVDGSQLLCRTPPTASNITQLSAVEVTLNGQQHTSDAARFDFFVPPMISAVYPLHGPTAGGTQILLTGTHFEDFGLVSVWPAARDDLRCRFGPSVLTPTTFITHESVVCTSPPLSDLGASGSLTFYFDVQPNASTLAGSARIEDGVLMLTQAAQYEVGTFIVHPHLHVEMVTSFDASFEILMGGGNATSNDPGHMYMWSRGFEPLGGMGMAFGYSMLDGEAFAGLPFGEMGPEPERGLRVSLFSYSSRAIEVAYDGVVLTKVPLGNNLRLQSWTQMRIAFVDDRANTTSGSSRSGGGYLSVWYDGEQRVHNLRVNGWGANSSWSWSLSAATMDVTDAHWVDNLVISASNLTAAEPSPLGATYPITLTLNRREHYESYASFGYALPPMLSYVRPQSGPRAGGTMVTLHGVNLANGTHYKCRFGGSPQGAVLGGRVLAGPQPGSLPLEQYMTPATYIGPEDVDVFGGRTALFREVHGAGAVTCLAPNVTDIDSRTVALELTLNGQEYTQQRLLFARHAPVLTSVYPLSGPRSGGFAIELLGADLSNGSEYRCRFEPPSNRVLGVAEEVGSGESGSGEGRRRLSETASNGTGSNATVSDDAGSGLGDAMLNISDPVPHLPPVVVSARHVYNATSAGRVDPHEAILCDVPSGSWRQRLPIVNGRVDVAVTLNGQQYTSRSESDVWWAPSAVELVVYDEPIAESISPSSGPSLGDTTIAVAGVNLVNGSNYTCRFGTNMRGPYGTLQDGGASVRCISPAVTMRDCASPSIACAVHPMRTANLDVALNGQDYAMRGRVFQPLVQYRPPAIFAVSPTTGPSAGGTMLTLRGVYNLSGGSDYRCRFAQNHTNATEGGENGSFEGASGEAGNGTVSTEQSTFAEYVVNATIAATFDAPTGVVRCVTPPLISPNATTPTTVHVTLNGQQYHSAAHAWDAELAVGNNGSAAQGADSDFIYFGAPRVTFISPTCGPTYGHTLLTLSGSQLTGGSDYRCRFGAARYLVNASTIAHVDGSHGSVSCLTPPGMHDVETLHLELALNGQESTNDGTSIVRYTPVALYTISPSSGPVEGGTLIRVGGNHSLTTRHGCDVRCKFAAHAPNAGAIVVQGSLHEVDTGIVHCTSPQGVGTGPLEISLNGQQYSRSRVQLATYPSPSLQEISPPLGPSSGSTVLVLTVAHLARVGTDVRCRFSSSTGGIRDILATYDPNTTNTHLLHCITPPDRPIGVDALQITLNGQQWSPSLQYDVLTPPALSGIYPLTTPELGGIVVTIHGEGFASDDNSIGVLEAASGELSEPSNDIVASANASANETNVTASAGGPMAHPGFDPQLLRCKFGMTTVLATLLNHSAVTCVVPPATASGFAVRRVIRFEDGMFMQVQDSLGNRWHHLNESDVVIIGTAIIEDEALKLTRAHPEEAGSFSFAAPALTGQNLTNYGAPAQFPLAFRLAFNLTIGTGFPYEGPLASREGGEGFSVSVGDVPITTPLGEYGAGDGLRISLRTRANLLSVEYADRILHSGPLPQAERLRSNQSFPVMLTLRNDSLSFELADTVVLRNAALTEWRDDAKPSWRFGFGARTNHIRGENHFVEHVVLDLGPGLDPQTVDVSVTSNGQQYAPMSDSVRLRYFGAPVPRSVGPSLGPAQGGTSVIVRGIELHGGSAYRCRFGTRVMHAVFNASEHSVRCTTPPLSETLDLIALLNVSNGTNASIAAIHSYADGSWSGFVRVPLAISINEQDYESAIPTTLIFSYYAQPRVLAVSPQAGPVRGSTFVTLVVAGLPSEEQGLPTGAVPECLFGDAIGAVGAVVNGTSAAAPFLPESMVASATSGDDVNETGSLLTCITPAAVAGHTPLFVSLNQQDYRTSGSNNFTFHDVTVVSALLPSGGPRHGGTVVTVTGHGLAPLRVSREPTLCRFGTTDVEATVGVGTGDLLCMSPPARVAEGELMVRVSADGSLDCQAAECTLGGNADINAEHVVRLTHSHPREVGQLTVTPRTTSPQLALATWNLTFEALSEVSGGMSISVGDVPSTSVGAAGGGAGLRLAFSPELHRITVSYKGDVLRTVQLTPHAPSARFCDEDDVCGYAVERRGGYTVDADGHVQPTGPPPDVWHALHVAYREDGLYVAFNRTAMISALPVRGYFPQPGWRLVIAASSEERYSRHLVRRLRLVADAAVHVAALPVAISLNGQQFTPPTEGVGSFRFVAHPHVLSVHPSSGPALGGTRVLVTGLVFADGGSSHKCRFGMAVAVDATRHAATGYLACVSPPASSSPGDSLPDGSFAIELTRDGQVFESDVVGRGHFAFLDYDSQPRTLLPASAPVSGGTRLHITGHGLGNGSSAQCRFDLRGLKVAARETALMQLTDEALLASTIGFNASLSVRPAMSIPAEYNASIGGLSCVMPRVELTDAQMVNGHGAFLPIAISLNGQQFAPWHEPPLRLYEPPRLDLVSPACGPVHGGTHITLAGSQLRGGSEYRCQFGGLGEQLTWEDATVDPRRGRMGRYIFEAAPVSVRANYSSTPYGDTIECETPVDTFGSSQGVDRWSVGLSVSLNGQQFDTLQGERTPPGTSPNFLPRRGFGVYADPLPTSASEVYPARARAGAEVTVFGTAMHAGCAYACRFGDDVMPGSYVENRGGVRCRVPNRPDGTVEAVWVSLNAQQFVPLALNMTWGARVREVEHVE